MTTTALPTAVRHPADVTALGTVPVSGPTPTTSSTSGRRARGRRRRRATGRRRHRHPRRARHRRSHALAPGSSRGRSTTGRSWRASPPRDRRAPLPRRPTGCHLDGALAADPGTDTVDELAAIVAEVGPDTVLTFGADGLTGHGDHRAVSAWTDRALRRVPLAAPAVARRGDAAVAGAGRRVRRGRSASAGGQRVSRRGPRTTRLVVDLELDGGAARPQGRRPARPGHPTRDPRSGGGPRPLPRRRGGGVVPGGAAVRVVGC